MNINSKTKKGFTLIELLVVISIVAILSGTVLTSLSTSRQKSRDAKRIADIKQLQLNLELYYDINRKYPGSLSGLVPTFTPSVPVPPGGGSYFYVPLNATCNAFHLGTALELSTNSALADDADLAVGTVATAGSCGTTVGGSDFNGQTVACTAGVSTTDQCYDVTS